MTEDRSSTFQKARSLHDSDKTSEAYDLLLPLVKDKEQELSPTEMETMSYILQEKITSASFDDKKDACYESIDLLEGMNLGKNERFLTVYTEAVYESFSKINRSAREEERENVWCRAKEMFLAIFSAVRKAIKEKNSPEKLEIYLSFAKLAKSYLDVADQDSLNICEDAAKDAKLAGKGGLSDDDFKEVKHTIEKINKCVSDARHERELLDDE